MHSELLRGAPREYDNSHEITAHRLENLGLDTKRDLEFGSEKVVLVYNWDHSTPETV